MTSTKNEHTLFVGVGCIFIQNGQILTVFRNNTKKNNNKHGLIGGLVADGESIAQAAIREIFEEVGVTVKPEDLRLVHTISSREDKQDSVGHYFLVEKWNGEPYNKATDKHERIEWFDMDKLPETLIERNKQAIENMFEEVPYSEYGW